MKQQVLFAATLASACVTDPKIFGATATNDDGADSPNDSSSAGCDPACPSTAIEVDGLPLVGTFDDAGDLLVGRIGENNEREVIRVSVDGEVGFLASDRASSDIVFNGAIATTQTLEQQRTQVAIRTAQGAIVFGPVEGQSSPGGTRAVVDGGVQLLTYRYQPAGVDLVVFDDKGPRANWTTVVDEVPEEVKLAGAGQPALPDEEIVVWLDPVTDGTPRTATVIRLDAAAVELARVEVTLGTDSVHAPVRAPGGWLLVGSNTSGLWHQRFDQQFQQLGPRVIDSSAPSENQLIRVDSLTDGFVALINDLTDPDNADTFIRSYDAAGGLLISEVVPPLGEPGQNQGISVYGLRTRADGMIAVWGFDARNDGDQVGWVRFYDPQ